LPAADVAIAVTAANAAIISLRIFSPWFLVGSEVTRMLQ
jgi:hypothetical protein